MSTLSAVMFGEFCLIIITLDMKKLLILIVTLLATSGCYSVDEQGHKYTSYGSNVYYFTHENHQYIRFGGGNDCGIVHNPDCPCMNAYKH